MSAAVRACALALLTGLVALQSPGQVSPPQVGLVRYSTGSVYPVLGVPGNYVIGKRLFDSVDALSFSAKGGLLSRNGSLLLLDERLTVVANSAAETQALVGIDSSLDSAIAWLPGRQVLVHWNGTSFVTVSVVQAPAGGVFGVSKVGPNRGILLSKAADAGVEETSFSLATGALVERTTLPGVAGDVYRQGEALLSVQSGQLLIATPDTGNSKAFPLQGKDVLFERVSGTCVHLRSRVSGRDWLLHLGSDQTSLYELPAPSSENTVGVVAP